MTTGENQAIADRLREMAALLEQQQANPFRVSAYRKAADTLVHLPDDVRALAQSGGSEGLVALPGIGRSIGAAIMEMLRTGAWGQLARLRGELEPEKLFRTIPGVGPKLAHEIHETLHVDTLEALEVAAGDGRLEAVRGVGPRRAAMLRGSLANILARRAPRRPPMGVGDEPDVAMLLDVDREYLRGAAAGRLPKIAPRRFNPRNEAWLPILHTQRDDWHFTVLFSNTERAHRYGRNWDWVVIYFQHDAIAEGQRTVVTETRGPLAGRRVVRGREAQCQAFYGGTESARLSERG